MKEKLVEMLELQDKLNIGTNDENWREGVTPNGKLINWKRAIYMETAEAIDSVSWKHWKNVEGGIDHANFQIELVDIWHFLMSYLLIFNSIDEVSSIVLQNLEQKSEIKLPKELNKENNLDIDLFLEPYEDLMMFSLINSDEDKYREDFIKQFFVCINSASMSFDNLYALYIGKNVLNKFRQDHGYKEGTYKKIWSNGEEDNVTMQSILKDNNNNIGFDELYKKLEEKYKK